MVKFTEIFADLYTALLRIDSPNMMPLARKEKTGIKTCLNAEFLAISVTLQHVAHVSKRCRAMGDFINHIALIRGWLIPPRPRCLCDDAFRSNCVPCEKPHW